MAQATVVAPKRDQQLWVAGQIMALVLPVGGFIAGAVLIRRGYGVRGAVLMAVSVVVVVVGLLLI